MSRKQTITKIPLHTKGGSLTLWGFFYTYFEIICKAFYWKAASTKREHLLQLANIIIPAIENHDETPITDYTALSIDRAIINLEKLGKKRGRKAKTEPYKESTLQQFRTVFRQILKMAEKLNMCSPMLLTENTREQKMSRKKRNLAVRRTMSPEEEVKFLLEILPKLPACGEARLAFVIYVTGIRPSEACGLNWDMLKCNSETGIEKVLLGQTVEPGYNSPKLEFKTSNGPRSIVIDELAYTLLMIVKKLLLVRWIQEGNSVETFGALPFGAKGNSLSKRCCNHDINDFINPVFEKIGIRSDELEGLKKEMQQEYEEFELCGYEVDANDYYCPSTYLLRHLYATVNVALRLSLSMRQYLQGHKVDDPAVNRRIFSSSPMQLLMQKRRQEHPLLNPLTPKVYAIEAGSPIGANGYSTTIMVPPGVGSVDLNVAAEEPGDTISIRISSLNGEPLDRDVRICSSWKNQPEEYTYPINVQRFYHEYYRDAAQMLLEAFPGLYDGVAPWDECKKTE